MNGSDRYRLGLIAAIIGIMVGVIVITQFFTGVMHFSDLFQSEPVQPTLPNLNSAAKDNLTVPPRLDQRPLELPAPSDSTTSVEKPGRHNVDKFSPNGSESAEKPAIADHARATSTPIPSPSPASEQLLSDILEVGILTHVEGLNDEFPREHLLAAVKSELPSVRTGLLRVRIDVTFVEPRTERSRIYGADIRGYILASIPTIPGCTRMFGTTATYSMMSTRLGLMKAINMHARAVADWLVRATKDGALKCPNGSD